MKAFTKPFLFILLLGVAPVASAALNVFACEPEWAALARELGGPDLKAFAATTAQQDPHHIQARPSLIAKMRRADLVVCTGAELEVGWLPMLLRQAGNGRVQPGRPGFFAAADYVQKLEVPVSVDRAEGDVHPQGNPHIHTDPRRVAKVAKALAERLEQVDPAHGDDYRKRYQDFAARWQAAIAGWERRAAPLKGGRVVAHHKDWIYLENWLGLEEVARLEPKPGLPPSPGHLAALKDQLAREPARMVLRTPYQDPRPSEWLAEHTGIKAVELPYTVGGSEDAQDLFGLFDVTVRRLLEGAQ